MTEVLAAIIGAIKIATALDLAGVVTDLVTLAKRWGASEADLKEQIADARKNRDAIIAAAKAKEWPASPPAGASSR